ncbi:maleylpyruvate isomerase family mycothiol-dependent enzyme [Umezawaea sp. Da 62-37]|uniref:maleylpyruvate isomerase family mycothiol-dependent enzyme n=1 Tax=Umezawaea sp. Da 62-37 TaxID=3075927 RepID=UPI0028F70439|nr:maleylpyruvate isomerase family mycothiol-dependent enzyme [Umezawaea sp. Da 62-37]WNV83224.1 maleylpyruvate isomerase family mycothiol-dependent enzyme [Umezawaea sp. Da 62-37]
MDPHALADVLRADAEAFAAAAGPVPLDRPVPRCDGMTVEGLVRHLGGIHRLVARWATDGRRPATWDDGPEAAELLDWYRIGAAALLVVLDPERAGEPAATWSAWDGTLGFWLRRMAHETAVHRVDAQAASGPAAPLDARLAADGVDEVLRLWLGTHQPPRVHADGRAIALRVPGREWTVALHPGVVDFCDGADPDAVVTGSSSAVDLWLWGRAGEEDLSIEGDPAVARALRAAVAAVTG